MLAVNQLGLLRVLRRNLGTANIVESSFGGLKSRTWRVKNWQDTSMVKRRAAALIAAEKSLGGS